MFRSAASRSSSSSSFPRVCGDVPHRLLSLGRLPQFSPRVRGCSSDPTRVCSHSGVFPACAGMFLLHEKIIHQNYSFPRVCGDVPSGAKTEKEFAQFSPRVRGCSVAHARAASLLSVFPACAGMFRIELTGQPIFSGFPRVCGDVPCVPSLSNSIVVFSPRVRGCSYS